jgi:hypothetical protein
LKFIAVGLRKQPLPVTQARKGTKKLSKTTDAKSVLADITGGMSDGALMEKYKLSAVGLESLLKKVYESETIWQIRTMDVVRDLVAGMLDGQYDRLMEKCKPSDEAVKKLWEQGELATFFDETADPRVKPSEGVISGREIVHDLLSGITCWELMLKYGLSGAQLKKDFEIVLEQRRKVALKISEDVRSGMTSTELTEKYQLSNSGLQEICQKLLSEGLLETADMESLKSADNGTSLHNERRNISRQSPSSSIIVCDMSNNGSTGIIKDITEKGLAVKEIEADIGEHKTFWVLGDDFSLTDSFQLEAQCRWVGNEGSEGQSVAGFQVVAISDQDLQSLQQFVEFLDLGWKEPDDHVETEN